jgi:hypothetical protein
VSASASPADASSPTPDELDARVTRKALLADPIPAASALLAFQLFVYGARWIGVTPATLAHGPLAPALSYATLIAGLAQVGAGVISIIRGSGYVGYVASTFGMWLIGFYLLGLDTKADPDAAAWFLIALVPVLVLLMIPAIIRRRVAFTIAFGAITTLVILDGFALHKLHDILAAVTTAKAAPDLSTPVNLLSLSGWFAFITVAALLWIAARGFFEAEGIIRPKGSH